MPSTYESTFLYPCAVSRYSFLCADEGLANLVAKRLAQVCETVKAVLDEIEASKRSSMSSVGRSSSGSSSSGESSHGGTGGDVTSRPLPPLPEEPDARPVSYHSQGVYDIASSETGGPGPTVQVSYQLYDTASPGTADSAMVHREGAVSIYDTASSAKIHGVDGIDFDAGFTEADFDAVTSGADQDYLSLEKPPSVCHPYVFFCFLSQPTLSYRTLRIFMHVYTPAKSTSVVC